MAMRLPEIDGARFLGNYLIVLYHACTVGQFCCLESVESRFWSFLNMVSYTVMGVLFLVSGYCFALGWCHDCYVSKLKRRVYRLVVPYVIWNVLFVLVYLLLSQCSSVFANRVAEPGLYSFKGVFKQIFCIFDGPIDGPLWYVRTVFCYAAMAPITIGLLKMKRGLFALFLVVAWGAFLK